jgi:hypothetical protein
METLPPVILRAIISGAFVLIAMLRQPLVGYFVVKEPISSQPKRQFFLDLSLCLLAGLIAATFNTITFGFPAASAVSLIFGCAVAGFFLAIDMALNRERLHEIVRRHHMETAGSIQTVILEELENFRGSAAQEDDITLVVAKLL